MAECCWAVQTSLHSCNTSLQPVTLPNVVFKTSESQGQMMHQRHEKTASCAGTAKPAFPTFASFGHENKPKTPPVQDGWAAF